MSPTARALLALETIQNNPGITASDLGERLGVSERAARRYVEILREADLPIDSVSGPYGGYRVGRGLRLPPLMFTAAEAMGLVMAVLEGHRAAADPADVVGGALAKILRTLPDGVAGPVRAYRDVQPFFSAITTRADPEIIGRLIEACTTARRLRIGYRGRPMEVDPWAVVLRHGYWYLLGWSRTADARRVLRIDRVDALEGLPGAFRPPEDLDPLAVLEEHLSQGWKHHVEVLIDAPPAAVARWLPRSLGRLSPDGENRTRLVATTDEPDWYARRLAMLEVPFRVLDGPELQSAVAELADRLRASATR